METITDTWVELTRCFILPKKVVKIVKHSSNTKNKYCLLVFEGDTIEVALVSKEDIEDSYGPSSIMYLTD